MDSILSIQTICFVIDFYSLCFEQSIYSLVDMIPSYNIEGPTFPRGSATEGGFYRLVCHEAGKVRRSLHLNSVRPSKRTIRLFFTANAKGALKFPGDNMA